jgi:AcrR family transcriptional regulator
MGLRELKAARTRKHIIDVAYEMFLADGYDQTTMEQIAERAEVGSSTLYRYFPSKDLLILDQLTHVLDMAGALQARPLDEPLEISLGIAIRDSLESVEDNERFAAIRRIIDVSPVPRARLWDIVVQARSDFELALAERMGRPADDLVVLMSAGMTFQVWEIAGEKWWSADGGASRPEILDGILTALPDLKLICPAPSAVLQAAGH